MDSVFFAQWIGESTSQAFFAVKIVLHFWIGDADCEKGKGACSPSVRCP